jgi:hypothetical protein
MQHSFKQEILSFNEQMHAFEDERRQDIEAIIGIIQSLNPSALEKYANHLRANLNGILKAASLEELELYQNSFNEVLHTLMIDEDVLGIYPCILHFQQVLDLSQANLERDQVQDEFIINMRMKWVDIGLKEFQKNIDELKLELKNRINYLVEKTIAHKKITELESALKKIEQIEKEMYATHQLTKEMIFIKDRGDFDSKRKIFADRLLFIKKLGWAEQGGKDLQNHFINVGQRHAGALYEARAAYLPGPTKSLRKAVDFGWIVLGAVLIVVGVVLSAPIVVLALGFAGLGYGVIDLAKEVTEPIATHNMPKLGKREIIKPEQPKLSSKEKIKRALKKALPIFISALALTTGILAFAFPPLGIPMAIIGLSLALIGVTLFGKSWYNEKQQSKKIATKHADIQNQFNSLFIKEQEKDAEAEKETEYKNLTNTYARAINSEAKIDLFLLKHKQNESLSREELSKLEPHQIQENETQIEKNQIKEKNIGEKKNKENKKNKKDEEDKDNENNDPHLHH